jgi:hypothetical protein
LRGRPNFVPLARDAARFSAVRSLINSTFVLGQRSEHADHHAPGGGGRVDAVRCRHQGDATIRECLDRLQDVECVSAQSVELPDHYGVALAYVGHQLGESGTVVACARHGVGERFRSSCSRQCLLLLIQRLADGADAHVPDPVTGRVLGVVLHRLSRNGFERRYETFHSETNF